MESLSRPLQGVQGAIPDTGDQVRVSQQPGSPGCPQHVLPVLILIQLFRSHRRILAVHGMGADRLERNALRRGMESLLRGS